MPKGAPTRPSSIHSTAASTGCAATVRRGASGGRLLPIGGDEGAHPVGGLGTLANPVIDARQIELELLLPTTGDRVEEAHVLKARATLALTAVGHDDVIEGLVAPSAPRQANGYHGLTALAPAATSRKGHPKKSADSTQRANPAPVFLPLEAPREIALGCS